MLIGVIADDFTGASDIANTLAKGIAPEGGLLTAQFSGIPKGNISKKIEAGVISLKSRSTPIEEAVAESLAALNWLLLQGCEQIVFKYCSTFDSTSDGNIGPVGEALAKAMDAKGVVVCPSFPDAGRTVYQGHLFVFDKLLNESGMQNHPLTPMIDPDLRRFLAKQTNVKIGHITRNVVSQGADAISSSLQHASKSGDVFCIVDAICNDDLLAIGDALSGVEFLTGGSGVAVGLPRNFIRNGQSAGGKCRFDPVQGKEAILVGSCSGATREQVAHHAKKYPVYAIDVPSVMTGKINSQFLVEFIERNHANAPLVYSSGDPDAVAQIQKTYGSEKVASALDELFSGAVRKLIQIGYRKIVVAGGETSGAVAKTTTETLNIDAMQIGPEIDPGIPVLCLSEEEPVLMALKSGNFGSIDFFEKSLAIMGGNHGGNNEH